MQQAKGLRSDNKEEKRQEQIKEEKQELRIKEEKLQEQIKEEKDNLQVKEEKLQEQIKEEKEKLRIKQDNFQVREEKLQNQKEEAMRKYYGQGEENKEYWKEVLKSLEDQQKRLEEEKGTLKEEKQELRIKEEKQELRIKEEKEELRIKEEKEKLRIKEEKQELRIKEEKQELRIKEEKLEIKEEKLQNQKEEAMRKYHGQGEENKEYWKEVLKSLEDQQTTLEEEKGTLKEEKEKLRIKEEKLQEQIKEEKEKLRIKEEKLQEQIKEEKEKLRIKWEKLELKEEDSICWTEIAWNCDTVGHKEGGNLFCLGGSFVDQFSSGQAKQEVLYCRECFNEQWRFIEEKVCKAGCLGWILGPPGTGKTMTTMSFLLSLSKDKKWGVMCVRVWKWGPVKVLQVDQGVLRVVEMTRNEIDKGLRRILREWTQSDKKYLVSLDGYQQGSHESVLTECVLWLHQDRANRRVVITTSMNSRAKKKPEQDRNEKVEELMVYSWTLEEYLEAIRHELFYLSVAGVMGWSLESDVTEAEKRSREVESKFQIVGGSCRYMFEHTTEKAINDLRQAMDSVADYKKLIDMSMGDTSDQFVNRLQGKYRMGSQVYWTLVSRFVATELAQRLGESFVREIEELSGMAANPTLKGVLFEMLFFARIGREPGLQVLLRSGRESEPQGVPEKWDRWDLYAVKYLGTSEIDEARRNGMTRMCLKPLKWNQGGYDAVIVDWNKTSVCFVQVTIAETHDLKLRYMSECLDSLGVEPGGNWEVRIVFIVKKENLYKFAVRHVENKDILRKYGWAYSQEEIDANVVGMDSGPRR